MLLHALCEWQFEDIDHFRSKIKLEDGEDESDWVLKIKKNEYAKDGLLIWVGTGRIRGLPRSEQTTSGTPIGCLTVLLRKKERYSQPVKQTSGYTVRPGPHRTPCRTVEPRHRPRRSRERRALDPRTRTRAGGPWYVEGSLVVCLHLTLSITKGVRDPRRVAPVPEKVPDEPREPRCRLVQVLYRGDHPSRRERHRGAAKVPAEARARGPAASPQAIHPYPSPRTCMTSELVAKPAI